MCQVHLDQELFVSGSLNFAVFNDGSSDFFEIAANVVVLGFVVVDVLDDIADDDDNDDDDDDDDDDDNIFDVIVVAVGLNLLMAWVFCLKIR